MFPKSNRLTRSEIKSVFKDGKRSRHTSFVFLTKPATNCTKMAIIIPTKVIVKASSRNSLRRHIYAQAKNILHHPNFVHCVLLFTSKPTDLFDDELSKLVN